LEHIYSGVLLKMIRIVAFIALLFIISGPAEAASSSDGSSIIGGGGGSLVTSDGTWTFDTVQQADGGNYAVQLNGVNLGTVAALRMHVTNNGTLYLVTAGGLWWRYDAPSLTRVTDPRPPTFGAPCQAGTQQISGPRTFLCDGHWSAFIIVNRSGW
jgi:hypothetical protein